MSLELVRELREKTGAGLLDCQKALGEASGDADKALRLLRERGLAKAAKKSTRVASDGLVGSYIHPGGKIGVLVEVNCETDFVARTEDFKTLAREIALHIASAAPVAVDKEGVSPEKVEVERRIAEEQATASGKPENIVQRMVEGKVEAYYKDNCLIYQPWIREPKKSIGDLIKETSAKVGENIQVRRFVRFQMGEE